MARKINRLNARSAATLTKYGRHADGGGLYLSISKPQKRKVGRSGPNATSPNGAGNAKGGRRWVFLYRWHGKPTEIGFGSARDVPLARARELAGQARAKLADGINPKGARKPPGGATFGECADRVIEAMRPSWRNSKHAAQWEMTLRKYAAPLRRLPADKITTDDVLSVLKPLWNEKPETASRLRGRIERVLDAAKAQGLRSGENPARWRGHLDQLLPKRQRLTRGHHAAMGYAAVPAFVADLQSRQATAALALEFAILTAARSGEVVFPGQKAGKPLSVMALEMVLRRMKIESATVHGFRSAFRDWASERTNFTSEVCEAALAHVIESKVEAAYRRGDLFDKRRKLMEAWAVYCAAPNASKVVTFRRKT